MTNCEKLQRKWLKKENVFYYLSKTIKLYVHYKYSEQLYSLQIFYCLTSARW